MLNIILDATYQTILMILMSSIVGILLGIPLGITTFITKNSMMNKNTFIHITITSLVNIIRSIPYVILIVVLFPITKLLVGTSIGTVAATVPLSLASIVLITKISEESLSSLDKGLIEMGLSLGFKPLQIVRHILLVEALPNICSGVILVIIQLVGYSALAGTVGGGGLGYIAIRYGYQRYDLLMLSIIIIILVSMVTLIQSSGDYFIKKMRK